MSLNDALAVSRATDLEIMSGGSKANEPSDPPLPEQIGKYRIESLIGKGASGRVYKGRDPFVHRDVAVKLSHLPPPSQIRNAGPGQTNAGEIERTFFLEARAAGMLQHPNIVTLYDAGMEGALAYLVMEYVDGDTLLSLCQVEGPRPPLNRVIEIIYKCAKALNYSHEKGVLHRDIKPTNIMITRMGVPKIMDFSIAEITHNPSAAGTMAMGSPLFMAPEQIRGQPPCPQTDLYALGAVMYHMLTGVPPYQGKDLSDLFKIICMAPVPWLGDLRPDLPRELGFVLNRLLAKKPEDRYASGNELAHTLLRLFERRKTTDHRALARRDGRDQLRGLAFFAKFTDAEIEEIIATSEVQRFPAGTEIITEGAVDSAFYLLVRGTAEVLKGTQPLSTLDRGDGFGEISLISAMRRSATVRALTDVKVLKINAERLEQMTTEAQLHFYKAFTEMLIYRLLMTNAKLQAASQTAG